MDGLGSYENSQTEHQTLQMKMAAEEHECAQRVEVRVWPPREEIHGGHFLYDVLGISTWHCIVSST